MITAIDKNTALVLIDLQNSVMAAPIVHSMDDILSNTNKLISIFREKNLPIVFVNVKPGGSWLNARKEAKMPAYPDDENLYKITGKLHTESSDIFVTKHTWNAFFETELNDELKRRNITGIVLAGVATSIGVEGTARAASELGYNVSFASDAMSDRNMEAHKHSLQYIFPRIGETGSTNDIIKVMKQL
jgi:nicotinamidase-related amidase